MEANRKQRDSVGRFTPGGPGGPGRPRNGVRAALARIVDWDELAEFVWGVVTDDKAPMRDRQWAAEFVADRLEGKPVSAIAVATMTAGASALPAGWSAMSPVERFAWIDSLRAGRALPAGGDE